MSQRITPPLAVNSAIRLFLGISKEILKATVLILFLFFSANLTMAQVTTTESFETAVPPTGWSSAIGSGTYNWARATTTGLPNGSYFAFYDSYHAVAGNYASMASAAFDLSSRGSNTPTVSFYFFRGTNYIDNPDYLEVYINTTNSLSGATILSTGTDTRLYRHYVLAPVAAASGWAQYTFTIPAGFNGTSNYIIFKAVSGWGDILDIDQVQIVAYPCVIPTITSTTPASGVGPNTYTLGATASQGTVNWYTAATGGSVIATGTSYTTPNISVTTTYYVNATYNVCASSPRVAIVATVASHYNAGTGITIAGTTITNTAPDQTVTLTTGTGISVTGTYPNFNISNTTPDQTVTLTGNGATSVSGTYPNFTISSTDNNTTYNAGTGIDISNGSITNTAPDQTVTLTGNGATSISGTYPNFTISSTDNNTTYNAGTGIDISNGSITNTAPDQTVTLTGNGATNVSGTYPNFTISSTDNNTSYNAGTGLSLTGNTFNSVWTADGNNIVNNNTGTVSISSLGGSGSSIVKVDNSGLLDKITMSGDNTQVLRADGTFGPIVYPPNSYRIASDVLQINKFLEIGNSVNIGGVIDSDPNSINQIFTDDHGALNMQDLLIQCNTQFSHNTILNKNNGNVGIGIKPDYKLDVNGTLRLKGIGEGRGKILTSNVDGLATWEDPLFTSVGTGTGLYLDGNNALNSVWTNIDNKLYNNNAANVGIGTDNPVTNLHLKGITDYTMALSHHSAVFRIEDSFIHSPGPPTASENRDVSWDFIVSAQERKFILTSNSGSVTNEVLNIKETGQVGIGVENPTESLEVNGAMVLGSTTNTNPVNGTMIFDTDKQLKVFVDGIWQNFSGLWTAGTGTIYSASTAKIGIGTDNPLVNFHIKGITDGSDVAPPPSPLSAIIRIEDKLINSGNDRDVSWDIIVSASHNKMVFKNNAGTSTFNSVLSIKENGSMGIGVDDPIEKLEVNGNIKMTDGNQGVDKVLISNNTGVGHWGSLSDIFTEKWQTATNANDIFNNSRRIGFGTNDPQTRFHIKNTEDQYFGSILLEGNSSFISFFPGSITTEPNPHANIGYQNIGSGQDFFINNIGGPNANIILGDWCKVGVKTITPSEQFEIGSGGNLCLKALDGYGINNNAGDIIFKNSELTQLGHIWTDQNDIGKLHISTLDDASAFTINSIGFVGVGTTDPKEKFQVGDRIVIHDGGTKVFGYNFTFDGVDKRIQTNEGTGMIRFSSNGSMEFRVAASESTDAIQNAKTSIYLKEDGTVGIGHNNPSATLDIKGSFKLNDNSGADFSNKVLIANADGLAHWGNVTEAFTDKWLTGTNHIYHLGDVHIGESGQTSNLDMFGNLIMNDNDIYFRSDVPDVNHGLGWYGIGKMFANAEINGSVLYGFNGGALGSNTFGTKKIALRWDATGSVGIGTLTPSEKLEIGDGGNISLVASASLPDKAGSIFFNNGNGTRQIASIVPYDQSYNNWSRLYFNVGDAINPIFTLDKKGEAGINKPEADNIDASLYVYSPNTTWYTGFLLDRRDAHPTVYSSDMQILTRPYTTEGLDRMSIEVKSDLASTFQVYANGTVNCNKIQTKYIEVRADPYNIPDYVFKNDYKLLKIDTLEQYIKTNCHLPNVPSAEEIGEKGMDLVKMNNTLLEKVEELTLYIIDLNKKVAILEDLSKKNKK